MKSDNGILLKILLYGFLTIVLVFTLFPLLYTVSASFKSSREILLGGINLIPQEFTFDNYSKAWVMANFSRYTLNSLYMTGLIVIGVLINSTIAAYVFDRGRFPGKALIFAVYLSTMFISAGAITLFPVVKIAALLGLKGLNGVVIINVFGMNAVYLFLAMGYFKTISREIDEAARIDGCSFFRTYWNILLPLAKPILATIALIAFRGAWNDYLLPLVLTMGRRDSFPLVVGVVSLRDEGGEGASQVNLMMAGTMFSILPIVILYLFLNKYFVSGLTSGAIKG